MSLGSRLLNLRKEKNLSQEEVAEKLDVTRQTVSKWETDQSTPDFDKIIPLCKLYGISSDELLTGANEKKNNTINTSESNTYEGLKKEKRAKGIGIGILLYFISVVWIMISVPVLLINPIVASAIFMLICGIATYYIVYSCIIYKKEKNEREKKEDNLRHQIAHVVAIITLIIYFIISFLTMAWHITWIIWIIYGLFEEILKLIFMLRGENNEE